MGRRWEPFFFAVTAFSVPSTPAISKIDGLEEGAEDREHVAGIDGEAEVGEVIVVDGSFYAVAEDVLTAEIVKVGVGGSEAVEDFA